MTTPLLTDSKGVKIGKSEGNVIGLIDNPNDFFGKIMSLGDDAIIPLFTLLTDVPIEEINKFDLKKDAMSLKKRVASILITQLHDKASAEDAEKNFSKTFQKKEIPDEMKEVKASGGELLSEVLVKNKILSSKGEWRRLILGNGVHDLSKNQNITDVNLKISENLTLKIGKKKFIKVTQK